MHLRRSLLAFGLFAAFAGQGAVVYKWTDADGVVHFSDQPVPGAEKIVTATSSAPAGTSSRGSASATGAAAKKKIPGSALNFNQLAIVSPAHDQTFTGNLPVNVSLNVDPGLKAHQTISWFLNGKRLDDQSPDAVQFTLENLARGAYTIGATIVDQDSGESTSAEAVNFFVMQPSVLSPQHK
jgi:Domain of unknown function (DUF4124)